MKPILSLLALSIFIMPVCVAQTVSGVSHTRVYQQVGPSETLQDRYVFRTFVEGAGIPFSSVSVQGPGLSESLTLDGGRWSFEDDLVGVSQAQYSSSYPDGTYTMDGGNGDVASVSLTSAYPNQPAVTVGHGSWQGGRLVLTAEQAQSDLSIVTNQSTGNGFVTLEILDQNTDEDLAYVTDDTGGVTGGMITYQIDGGTLLPGHRYEVYVEFDQVTDSESGSFALDGGTTFALASSGTKLEIYVQREVLAATFTATGPKSGRLDFATERGFIYKFMRSTTLREGTEIDSLNGAGINASFTYDDSASTDSAAFFWIESEAISTAPSPAAFATLIGGKTFLGYNLTGGNRWSQFGYTGNYTYVSTGPQAGRLTLTYDDLGNDPSNERDVFDLNFGADGDTSTVEVSYSFYKNDVEIWSSNHNLDLTQSSFAPVIEILEDLLVGQTHLGYTFTSLSRFTFAGNEPGDWSYTYLDDDSILLTMTYDEDGNNPAVYREEITLNFNGTNNVPYQYEEYDNGSSIASSTGSVELIQPD